jgi:hypothetical protein
LFQPKWPRARADTLLKSALEMLLLELNHSAEGDIDGNACRWGSAGFTALETGLHCQRGGSDLARSGVLEECGRWGAIGNNSSCRREHRAPSGYTLLGPEEASFLETVVNVMCPADSLSPNGRP